MGFSGGGGAGGQTVAHLHTNAAGQGGPLDSTSLLNVATLASQLGAMEPLLDYEAAVAEGSHTFTLPSAIDFDDDSYLLLVIDLGSTASFALELGVNGITSATYHTDGFRIDAGTETIIDQNLVALWEIASVTMITAANRPIAAIITIQLNKAGPSDRVAISSNAISSVLAITETITGGFQTTSTASITSLEVTASASTWQIGTRMTLYQVSRVI